MIRSEEHIYSCYIKLMKYSEWDKKGVNFKETLMFNRFLLNVHKKELFEEICTTLQIDNICNWLNKIIDKWQRV